MKALVLIDVQEDYTNPKRFLPLVPEKVDSMIHIANHLIEKANKTGCQVVYVRQVYATFAARIFARVFGGGLAISGKPGTEIDKRVKILSTNIFDKERP